MSVSAPRMSVKSHFPWPLKAIFLVLIIAFGATIALWAYYSGRNFASANAVTARDVAALNRQIADLMVERDRFSSVVNAAESQANIASATQTHLSQQIATLEADNAKLKEDLAFFEGLLPIATGSDDIAIQRLSFALTAPTQLRYRSLIMRGGKVGRDFVGDLQIVVTAVVRGKNLILTYPEQSANSPEKAAFQLDFKYYQRIDGVLTLPDGTVVKRVQARVRENGKVRTQQSANL
ncbi:hypothetical protein HAV38_00155 [Glaciimonas immobilis]|nr:hypothetical protein HAV38_00155 [Glaciimonas immobilis]